MERPATQGYLGSRVPVSLSSEDAAAIEQLSTDQVGCYAYLGADQTISSGTITVVNLDSVQREDSEIFTIDTANHNIDVLVDGFFLLIAGVRWNSSADWTTGDQAFAHPFVNGSDTANDFFGLKTGTGYEGIHFSIMKWLTEGDTVDLRVRQDSGVDQVISGGSVERTFLIMGRLG